MNPWRLHVTDTHEQYDVDGAWLDKEQIDWTYYIHVADLSGGDIIKVSSASHNNTKNRNYRVVAVTGTALYYSPEYELDDSVGIKEVA